MDDQPPTETYTLSWPELQTIYVHIEPPRPQGWEGPGARAQDDARPAAAERGLRAALTRMNAGLKGVAVPEAISALHGQRRADGRPAVYLPEGN